MPVFQSILYANPFLCFVPFPKTFSSRKGCDNSIKKKKSSQRKTERDLAFSCKLPRANRQPRSDGPVRQSSAECKLQQAQDDPFYAPDKGKIYGGNPGLQKCGEQAMDNLVKPRKVHAL